MLAEAAIRNVFCSVSAVILRICSFVRAIIASGNPSEA
jgi:hypothetical protein